jgi:hypothetical protein
MISSTQLNQAKQIYAYKGLAPLLLHINKILKGRCLDPYEQRALRLGMVKRVRRDVREEENQ